MKHTITNSHLNINRMLFYASYHQKNINPLNINENLKMMKRILALVFVAALIHQLNCCFFKDKICTNVATKYTYKSSDPQFSLSLNDPSNKRVAGTVVARVRGNITVELRDEDGDVESGLTVVLEGYKSLKISFFSNNAGNWSIECAQQLLGITTVNFQVPICNNDTLAYTKDSLLYYKINEKEETLNASSFPGISNIFENAKCN
jgi:hypothetical protein